MIIYENTLNNFIDDVIMNTITDKILSMLKQRHLSGGSTGEIHSWNNSLHFMKDVLDTPSMPKDCMVAVEYNIPQTSKRVDFLIAGMDDEGNYLISLSDTKEMIISKIGLNDFDITTFEDIVAEEVTSKKMILGNQVINVKGISSGFRLIIAKQKAKGVIDRIYNMNFNKPVNNSYVENEKEIPELVIGPKEVITPRVDDVIFDDVKPEEVSFSNNDEEILTIEPDLIVFPIKKEREEEIFFDKNEELNVIYKEK